MISGTAPDLAVKVSECQQVTLEYEGLMHQIAKLLVINGGITRNLSDDDFATYRRLAERRDLAHNRLRILEWLLLDE